MATFLRLRFLKLRQLAQDLPIISLASSFERQFKKNKP